MRTPLDGLFGERLTALRSPRVRTRFDERHAQIHGHAAKERPGGDRELPPAGARDRAQIPAACRRRAALAAPGRDRRQGPAPDSSPTGPARASGGAKGGGSVHAVLYERDRLDIGAALNGPAIVEQFDATTVIPPGWSATVDAYRNLILRSD